MIVGHRCQIRHLWPMIMEQPAALAAAGHGYIRRKQENSDHISLPSLAGYAR
jgi:hypothetical protein